MEMNDYNYNEIKIGQEFEFKKTLTEKNIDEFAKLTGDFNSLHCDEEYAKNTRFKGKIMHGMLAGSLFSTLVGMVCPGKKNLYLAQSLNFKKPIYPNSDLIVKGIIKEKIDSIKMITIQTEILIGEEIIINGEAKVRLLEDEK